MPPGSPNPDPISGQNMAFSTPVQTWPLKSIPVFRPGFWRNKLRISAEVKNWQNSPENSARMIYFGCFLSTLFIWN